MANRDTIILLTNREDITCDFIVQTLQTKGLSFERLNTDTWLNEANISLEFPNYKASGIFLLFDRSKAVYFRHPILPDLSQFIDEPELILYCKAKWQAFYDSLYACYQSKYPWINPPFSIRIAENKPYQLQVAEEIGFFIPETRITNSKSVIEELLRARNTLGCVGS